MMPKHGLFKTVVSATLCIGLVVGAVFWNEARKEVVYLCPNFAQGVSEHKVMLQLNTVTLSKFEVKDSDSSTPAKTILLSSDPLNLVVCQIEIGSSGSVISASTD